MTLWRKDTDRVTIPNLKHSNTARSEDADDQRGAVGPKAWGVGGVVRAASVRSGFASIPLLVNSVLSVSNITLDTIYPSRTYLLGNGLYQEIPGVLGCKCPCGVLRTSVSVPILGQGAGNHFACDVNREPRPTIRPKGGSTAMPVCNARYKRLPERRAEVKA